MIEHLLLVWAVALASDAPAVAAPPKSPLICRYDAPINSFLSRRKMCLTASEWEQRDRDGAEASRKMLYENMGDTDCMNSKGICISLKR